MQSDAICSLCTRNAEYSSCITLATHEYTIISYGRGYTITELCNRICHVTIAESPWSFGSAACRLSLVMSIRTRNRTFNFRGISMNRLHSLVASVESVFPTQTPQVNHTHLLTLYFIIYPFSLPISVSIHHPNAQKGRWTILSFHNLFSSQ